MSDQFYQVFGEVVFKISICLLVGLFLRFIWVNIPYIYDWLNKTLLIKFYYRYYIKRKKAPSDILRKNFKIPYFYHRKHLRYQCFMYRLRNIKQSLKVN